MLQDDEYLTQQRCRTLLDDYAVAVDLGDAAAMVDLFTVDGTIRRGELILQGQGELPKILSGRPDDLVMRHLLTTVRIRARDDGSADGLCYYLLFNGRGPDLPLPLNPPFSMGEWHSRFVRTAQGWKLASHEIRRIFVRADKVERSADGGGQGRAV